MTVAGFIDKHADSLISLLDAFTTSADERRELELERLRADQARSQSAAAVAPNPMMVAGVLLAVGVGLWLLVK